jgi:hypothetical protein
MPFRTAVLLLIGLTACSTGDSNIPNPYNLTTDLKGNPAIERTWVEPTVKRVATLSGGPDHTLYNPNEVEIGDDGRIYVFDFGSIALFEPIECKNTSVDCSDRALDAN